MLLFTVFLNPSEFLIKCDGREQNIRLVTCSLARLLTCDCYFSEDFNGTRKHFSLVVCIILQILDMGKSSGPRQFLDPYV